MNDNPYKCENHKIDLVCHGCVRAWIRRHDMMLAFIRDLQVGVTRKSKSDYDEGFIDAANEVAQQATDLLNEIGKNNG